jgi:V-type H+-transporting ATPase subunit d
MDLAFFNVQDGYSEGIVRGMRSGFLTVDDYRRLAGAESLDDVRTALDDTDYGSFLQDEPSPLEISTIVTKAKEKMAAEFNYIKAQSVGGLIQFLEMVAVEKMIDNVVNLLQGTLNGKPADELLAKVDPIGWFEEMKTIPLMDLSQGYDEIYRTILIETPVGPYFEEFLRSVASEDGKPVKETEVAGILTDSDMELMKSILKKAWMQDFYKFCQKMGGQTAEVMGHCLKVEADFRVLNITLNSLNTSLGSSANVAERNRLFPNIGYLYPEGTDKICKAWNQTTVRAALEPYIVYKDLFETVKMFYDKERKAEAGAIKRNNKSMEDMFYAETAKLYELTFDQQFHYGVFYAWVKLKEQEIRNLSWICNMIVMNKKEFADDIVPLFVPKA